MKRLLVPFALIILLLPAQLGAEECNTPLVVANLEVQWADVETTVENDTSSPESGGLAIQFTMNGHNHHWWFDGITVPAQTNWIVEIEFPSTVSGVQAEACDKKPDGTVDAPDPVANSMKQYAE